MTRRVALVSGHFFPSNLVGAQRARLWAQYLPEFGWEPIVVAGDPERYEERPDPELMRLLSPQLRVIHAATLSTRPIRLVGDIGVRAFWGCYRALSALAVAGEINFIHVIIPSNFLGPVGRLVHRRYGVPYGIDYVDPWVNRWPGIERPFSRAWGSYHLARLLEPWAVRDAALITGVAPGYVSGMLERNPEVAKNAELAYMPFGISPEDFGPVRDMPRAPFLFDPRDGCFHMIYGGALLPAGLVVLDAFLSGLSVLRKTAPDVAARLRVHFTGTGTSPDDPKGYQVLSRARRLGVDEMVSENPHRIGYVDMLNHLMQSNAVLVLGSTEPHYSPSKVFQGMLSRRPVFALMHEQSTAVAMIRAAHAGRVTTLTEEVLPTPEIIAAALRAFIEDSATFDPDTVDRSGFEAFSARHSTRVLAEALDRAYTRHRARLVHQSN